MENSVLHQVQCLIHCVPEEASLKDLGHVLNCLSKEGCGGFLLSEDNENPNEVRSASIAITHSLKLITGTLLYGKKVGRLSCSINNTEFRNVLLFFPNPEDPISFQDQEPYVSNKESFLRALSERIVFIVDLHYKIHRGLGRHLIMGEFHQV